MTRPGTCSCSPATRLTVRAVYSLRRELLIEFAERYGFQTACRAAVAGARQHRHGIAPATAARTSSTAPPLSQRGRGTWHDQPFSAEVTLPPLGVVWLVPEAEPAVSKSGASPAVDVAPAALSHFLGMASRGLLRAGVIPCPYHNHSGRNQRTRPNPQEAARRRPSAAPLMIRPASTSGTYATVSGSPPTSSTVVTPKRPFSRLVRPSAATLTSQQNPLSVGFSYKRDAPGVVEISITTQSSGGGFFDARAAGPQEAQGSGFVYDAGRHRHRPACRHAGASIDLKLQKFPNGATYRRQSFSAFRLERPGQ